MRKLSKTGISFIICLFVGLFIWSCANISYPSGGEKDETPPVVLKATPPDGTLNFSAKRFEMTFDEFIEIKNLEENFISSPPFTEKPDITVIGKRLRFTFQDTLLPNSTYRIQFGDAIVDLNEGNPFSGFEYVLSTGEFIDSMSIRGVLKNAFDQKPEAKMYIVLYEDFYDSVFALKKPFYVTKTKEDGSFLLKNLRNTSYKVLALKDMNANLLYDLSTENIGFYDDMVTPFAFNDSIVLDSFPSIVINSFIPDDTVQRVLFSDFVANGTFQIVTKLPVENLQFESIPKEICLEQNASKDTFMVWLPPLEKDSIFMILKDSETVIDTIREKYYEGAIDQKNLPKFFETNISAIFPYYEQFTLKFSSPLLSFDTIGAIALIYKTDTILPISTFDTIPTDSIDHSIFERVDSVPTTIFDTVSVPYHLADTGCSRTVVIDVEPEQGMEYSFYFVGNAFHSIYEETNDTIAIKTTVSKEEDYGTFRFAFKGEKKKQYLIQLWTAKEDKIVQEDVIVSRGSITYIHLAIGDYKIKIIEDRNRNGKWDSGNYWTQTQPEAVRYFEKPISIRANWELEESFKWEE